MSIRLSSSCRMYGIVSAVTVSTLLLSQVAPLVAFASSPPDAPTNLSATPGDGSAALSWSAPENSGSSSITGYKIEDSLHKAPLNFNKLYDAGVISADNGTSPVGNVLSYNGKLYGMTQGGGANDEGTIFSLDPSGNTFTVLHDFTTSYGDNLNPSDSLIEAGGIFYGMTEKGGANDSGTIFSFDPSGNTFTVLYSFSAATGDKPFGTLIDVGGILYGTAEFDGAGDSGVIFGYNLSTNTYSDLHDFNQNVEGANPGGALIDVGGLLYGTTQTGGVHGGGTLFTFDPSNNTFADIHDFNSGTDGSKPGAYLLDAGGIVYGTAAFEGTHNGGTIFSYNTSNTTFTTIFNFDPATDGSDPEGGLTYISGVLYGTTKNDGANGSGGTVYSYAISGDTFTDLHDFDNNDPNNAGNPQGGVVNVGGTLYGLTSSNVFFSIASSGTNFTVVHLFGTPITFGGGPGNTLLPYQGLLYGVMSGGGTHDSGVIFSFDPSDDTYHDLYDLNYSADGSTPLGGLINVNGIFYGVTTSGGANDYGTLFSFDPSNDTFTKLHDLNLDTDGGRVYGNLLDVNGVLYGMTYAGGLDGNGVIFSFDPAHDTFADVHDFNGDDGGFPNGSLINVGGILYGLTTSKGVNNDGTLFSLNPSDDAFRVLHAFSAASDGSDPPGNLLDVGGVLYGMTSVGGANDYGTIFSYDVSHDTFTKLHDFDSSTEGDGPYSSFVELGGLLYSSTGEGGSGSVGTLFSFDPSDNAVTVLRSLDRVADGAYAEGTFVNVGGTLYGTINAGGANNGGGTIFSLSRNWTSTTQSGAAITGTVSGLTNGTKYDFRVSASNSFGTGAPSDIATAMPEAAGGTGTTTPSRTYTSGVSGGQSARVPVRTPATTPTTPAGTIASLQAQLAALIAQLAALQGGSSQPSGMNSSFPTSSNAAYTRDLQTGSFGSDVTSLQNFLITKGFSILAGATGYFGAQTKSALVAYQKVNGIAPAAGYFGPLTKAYVASH